MVLYTFLYKAVCIYLYIGLLSGFYFMRSFIKLDGQRALLKLKRYDVVSFSYRNVFA